MSVDEYMYEDSYENRHNYPEANPDYEYDCWIDDVLPECFCAYCRTKRYMRQAYIDGPDVWLWIVSNHGLFEAFADHFAEEVIAGNTADAYALTSGAYAVKIARKVAGDYCTHAYGRACVTVLP